MYLLTARFRSGRDQEVVRWLHSHCRTVLEPKPESRQEAEPVGVSMKLTVVEEMGIPPQPLRCRVSVVGFSELAAGPLGKTLESPFRYPPLEVRGKTLESLQGNCGNSLGLLVNPGLERYLGDLAFGRELVIEVSQKALVFDGTGPRHLWLVRELRAQSESLDRLLHPLGSPP
jgi:hypothetical protein